MKKLIYLIIWLAVSISVVEAQSKSELSIIKIGDKNYYLHTVESGETITSISRKYDVSPKDIVDENPLAIEILKPGQLLKIPSQPNSKYLTRRQIRRNFIEHTITAGETLYSIAKKYDISISELMTDNEEADPITLEIGKRLLIRRKSIGSTNSQQLEQEITQYKEHLDNFSDNYIHHIVEGKETVYGLSRQYGISEEQFLLLNPDVSKEGLKIGAIVKLPKISEPNPEPSTEQNTIHTQEQEFNQTHFDSFNTASYNDKSLRMALMLPFTTNGKENHSFVDFYRGVIIALEEIRRDNQLDISLSVVDTERSEEKVFHALNNPEFESVNLIIGPVYDNTFNAAASFAMRRNIPIVSPLAQVSSENPNVFQIAPEKAERIELLKRYLQTERNIIVIRPEKFLDTEFASEIMPLLPDEKKFIEYHDTTAITLFDESLSLEQENLIITLSTNETLTEEILARISSSQNNIAATKNVTPKIQILGSSKLSRFENIDKELYFKLNVIYPTNYHTDRSNPKVTTFDKLFIEKFNTLPTPFAYRGYDVAMLFVTNISGNLGDNLTMGRFLFLQMPYNFVRTQTGKYVNNCWQLVRYRNNYTIELTDM